MSIELPHEAAVLLNVLGVPYPDIDEDQVRELAGQVRAFAANVAQTHASATGAVRDMGVVYSGYSYEQLVALWARMSAGHMAELDRACEVVASVLEVAAEVIAVVKAAVLAELAVLAAGYASLLTASVATMGVSAALTAAVRAAAARLLTAMEQTLIAYVAAEVVGKAIEPLEDLVSRMLDGVIYDAAEHILGVPPSSNVPLHIEPDEVMRYADLLDRYADDIVRHAVRFANSVSVLDFGAADRSEKIDGPQSPPAAPQSGSGDVPPVTTDHGVAAPGDTNTFPAEEVSAHGRAAERAAHPGRYEPGSAERPGSTAADENLSVDESGWRNEGAAAEGPGVRLSRDGVSRLNDSGVTENPSTDEGSAVRTPSAPAPDTSQPVLARQESSTLDQQDSLPGPATVNAAPTASAPMSNPHQATDRNSPQLDRGQSGAYENAQPSPNRPQPSTPWKRPQPSDRRPTRKPPRRRVIGRTGNRSQDAPDIPRTPWSKKTPAPSPTPTVFAPEPAETTTPPKSPERQADPAPNTPSPHPAPPDPPR
ncbi:hypothetical protein [Nocardia wallacei]|uniref:WXG100-like domain-containing protein n=1 Tax=Nocardia wallacei TaxID=480035 RepID=UPI00245870E6|nr:hypothetical protein [Nocardia wallacei]